LGGFYRPPNVQNWEVIEQSIDLAASTNITHMVITGDFNDNLLAVKRHNSRMGQLINRFNLTQLITEPTHFTESSATLIDLMLVNDGNNVKISGVGEPVYSDAVRYHCPVYCVLNFLNRVNLRTNG
jgi:hypothetical protein